MNAKIIALTLTLFFSHTAKAQESIAPETVAPEAPAPAVAPSATADRGTVSGPGTSETLVFRTRGNSFNPDISANFLGLYQRGTGLSDVRTDSDRNGFTLQEAELQFTADVDPYTRAVALFGIAQGEATSDYAIEPEEVFLETTSLPIVAIKAGKFRLAFGKHNLLHTHAFPFINAPLVHEELFGDEGLNEVGMSVSALMPTPWYSEVVGQVFTPSNENLYNTANSGTIAGLARYRNLFDLSESTTLEAGISGTTGKNEFDLTSRAYGADLTFKWRPTAGGKYRALVWSTEYIQAERKGFTDADTGDSTANQGGVASWVQYQFAQRWWAQGRAEYLGIDRDPGIVPVRRQSVLLGFIPTEFTGLRLQYDHIRNTARDRTDHTIAFQYNIAIGAHPAHAY